MAASAHQEYRTKELSLAVLLNMRGHTHQRLEMRGRRAVWVFADNGPLGDCVEEFQAGEARVEPKAFSIELAQVRNEMYRFLDGNGNG